MGNRMSTHLHNSLVVLAVAVGVCIAFVAFLLLVYVTNGIGTLVLLAFPASYAICNINGWLK